MEGEKPGIRPHGTILALLEILRCITLILKARAVALVVAKLSKPRRLRGAYWPITWMKLRRRRCESKPHQSAAG
jgi:hypothetical protein